PGDGWLGRSDLLYWVYGVGLCQLRGWYRGRPDGRAQIYHPETDRLDLGGGERIEPGAGLRGPVRAARIDPAVAQPGAHIQFRVGHIPLDDPGLDPVVGQPGGDPVAPVLTASVHPGGQQGGDPARVQMLRGGGDDQPGGAVEIQAG